MRVTGAVDHIQRGRGSYAKRAWTDAYESLSRADRAQPLAAEDLESLATSAYMLGRDEDYVSAMERAYQAHLDAGADLRAARCAFWIAINLILRGRHGGATGWLGRARRIVERQQRDCVERGYLLLADMFEHEAAGDLEAAASVAAEAAAIGERFGDTDLLALAAEDQGLLLIELGRVVEGLALLDEAMVAVTAGELSPMVNGFVYCGVITGCQAAYEPRRAQEWTEALTTWCEQQPDLVSFTGTCLVHRAEIMQLHGAWPDALAGGAAGGRALRAGEQRVGGRPGALPGGGDPSPAGRVRRGRGGLSRSASRRLRAAAGPRAAAPGAGQRRRGRRRDRTCRGRGGPAVEADQDAARLRRDHAGDRRRPSGAPRRRRARSSSPSAGRGRWWARWRRTPAAPSSWPAAMPARRSSRCVAPTRPGAGSTHRTRRRAPAS